MIVASYLCLLLSNGGHASVLRSTALPLDDFPRQAPIAEDYALLLAEMISSSEVATKLKHFALGCSPMLN